MLGSRYVLHDFHIKLIRRYLRDVLGWERWRRAELSGVVAKRRFGVLGWNVLHPTRMAFEGVPILALLAVLAAVAYVWTSHAPGWAAVAGGVAGWALGAAVTVGLHRTFERASDV
jgi:hypothetical protein